MHFAVASFVLWTAGAFAAEEEDGVGCPDAFVLNPKDTDRDTFLRQFKPCGYYAAHCSHKFNEWFPNQANTEIEKFEPNVCYPRSGNNGATKGVNLVQFDIGLDEETYAGYQDLLGEYGPLIDDADGDTRKYLDIGNPVGSPDQPIWTSEDKVFELGESCLETFVETLDDWGNIEGEQHTNSYGCMGLCGPGCTGVGTGRDCVKHDVCSYFKSLALDENSEGFCRDFDCGDEAAQTVSSCWIEKAWRFDENVICDEDEDANNPNFYYVLNPAARLQSQKRDCSLRTGWDRKQGLPWAREEDGSYCTSDDDCQSRRCDWFRCRARLELGERCDEDTDCVSLNCGGNFFNRRCRASDEVSWLRVASLQAKY